MKTPITDALDKINDGLRSLCGAMEEEDWFQMEGEAYEMVDLLGQIRAMYERSRSTGVEEGK